MNNQNILALDLATNTGWAIRMRDGTIKFGSFNSAVARGAKHTQRWANFRYELGPLITANDIHAVVHEDVKRHSSALSAKAYYGFLCITEMIAVNHNVNLTGLGVGTVKKHWTGKGRASKDEMVAIARAKGFNVANDDEADALAILHCYLGV